MSFTPYQVDFSTKNTSKTFGFSKKRIAFKFGVANNEAIAQGLTGAHCRGSEHEIIFIWSLNSGKRQIVADGKDVHFSESGLNGWTSDQVFQHHFQLKIPNFTVPLRCHLVTQPANRDVPSIRPFDLRVNGSSFFTFSKIYELGTPKMITRPLKGGNHRGHQYHGEEEDPHVTHEERQAIAAAKLASIRDMRGDGGGASHAQSAPAAMTRNEDNLINLLEDPTPAPPPVPPPGGNSQFVSSLTLDPSLNPGAQRAAPAPYGQQPYGNYALNTQQPPAQPNFASAPPAYGQPPMPQAPAPAPFGQPMQQPPAYGQPPGAPSNALTPVYQQPGSQPYYQGAPAGQAPQQGFGGAPPASMVSPTGQSIASYGSAPTFAQPPRQQQQPGYPQF